MVRSVAFAFLCCTAAVGQAAAAALELAAGTALALESAGLQECQAGSCAAHWLQTSAAREVVSGRGGGAAAKPATPPSLCQRLDLGLSWPVAVASMACGTLAVLALTWALAVPPSEAPAAAESAAISGAAAAPQKAPYGPQVLCLDGLRTLLVAYIIYARIGQSVKLVSPQLFTHDKALAPFFFALSGFVLCYSGADTEAQEAGAAGRFLARRLARLSPIYYLVLWWSLLSTYVWRLQDGAVLAAWPLSSIFMQAFVPLKHCSAFVTGTGWWNIGSATLSQGWFVSALVLVMPVFPILSRTISERTAPQVFGLLAAVLLLRSAPLLLQSDLEEVDKTLQLRFFFLQRLPEFAAGVITGRLFRLLTPVQLAWRGWGWIFDLALAASAALMLHSGFVTVDGDSMLTGPFCLICLAAACSASSSEGGYPTSGLLGPALACWPFRKLAAYSYGAFLAQDVLSHGTQIGFWEQPESNDAKAVLAVVACFILAAAMLPTEKAWLRKINGRMCRAKL